MGWVWVWTDGEWCLVRYVDFVGDRSGGGSVSMVGKHFREVGDQVSEVLSWRWSGKPLAGVAVGPGDLSFVDVVGFCGRCVG